METAAKERLISADSHVHFTDEWVKERLPQKLHSVWDLAGIKLQQQGEKLRAGHPPIQLEDLVDADAANDPGHFDPYAKLKAMDRDGVEAEVIFPELGGSTLCTPEFMGSDWQDVLSGYNDAMADFASIDRNRLLTAYQIQLHDVDFAVKEVYRMADRGARCVQITPFPQEYGLPDVHDRRYDPLWSALQETGITILHHLELTTAFWGVFRRDPTPNKGISSASPAMTLDDILCFWILTGTLERFPKLKVMLVEPALFWLPGYFELVLDGRMHQHYQFPGVKLLPSEYFKRQMGVTFMYEPMGLAACYKAFGPDVLYWSTDFPHPATCWPNSQKQVKEQFSAAGIPEHDKQKIIHGNAMNMFGLGVKK